MSYPRPPAGSNGVGRIPLKAEGKQRDVTGRGKGMPLDFLTQRMNASDWWSRGGTGKGIRIAIFDTGISPSQDFIRNLKEAVDFTPEKTTTDAVGHSSFMAGVIASNR